MKRTFKSIFVRGIAFSSTLVFSFALMTFLPGASRRRQQHFAEATIDGNLSRMRWLHFSGARIDAQSKLGNPLFLAASEGKLEVVRYLLDQGAEVNARDQRGGTALIEATFAGHIDVVKELLLRGADININSESGTALDVALERKDQTVASYLRHHGGQTSSEIRNGG
jgi:ankyrin repeat protein